MKKIIITTTVILITITSLLSQKSDIIYYENFEDNSNNWETIKNGNELAEISDGIYTIKSSMQQSLRWYGMQNFIDYRKNFKIEVKLRQVDGNKTQGYGIVWGSKGWENCYEFIITSSGYFNVGGYEDGKYFSTKAWTKSSKINSQGKYNILTVEKEGINFNYYINNEQVYTTKFSRFYGQVHGFMLKQNVTAEIDYYKISSTSRKIDVATTIMSGKQKVNLGSNVNSSYSEIAPIISPDGKILYVGRIYHPNNLGVLHECDIWYSELQSDSSWSKLKNIGKPLNNSGVNVVITGTPDGNALLVEGLYNKDGSHKSEQGISIADKTQSGWSVPKEVKIKNFYNTHEYETYSLSNDRKVILMSIQRKDTFGDMDLYISFLQNDGSYSEPKNMGPVLNTFAQDGTPFLASDNKTLYFSSYGHHGFGSADIFVSKRLDESWLRWSKPKNLGANVNTLDWDTYLSISAKGDYAYLVSTSGSIGAEDIYRLELEKEMQPDPVALVYGKVYDEESKKPIGAKITYQDLTTGKEVGIAQSNPKTGEYKITLPYGKKYAFRAESKDYIAGNENIDLTLNKEYKEIKRDLFLFKMEVGEVVTLKNVFFKRGSSDLMETSNAELDRIVNIMRKNPSMKVEIMGHTDNRGNAELLQKLSEERVESVKSYIVAKGINGNRITGKGYGGSQTIHENDSENEHLKNRRVEFKITKI